ncbi:hypothetical protein Aduo_005211 [Ancylostoma duodenale]
MQLTTFLPCFAALFAAVHGQYYPQQASQQYYPQQQYAPQQQYPGQWRQWDQPQSYQSQPQFLPQQPVQANYQQNFAFPPQQQRFALPQYQQQVPPPPQQFIPTVQQFQQQVPQFAQQQYQPRPPPPPSVVFNQPPPPPPPQPVQQAVFKPRPAYREGPRIYEQQFKINKPMPAEGFMPQVVEPQLPIQQRIRVPPPPERFHPHLADIYGQPSLPDRPSSSTRPTIILIGESLPEGAYGAEERLIDGNHPSYIEDTAKTTPVEQFRKFVQPQVVVPKPAPRRPVVRPQPAVSPRVVAPTRAPSPSPVIIKTHPAAVVPKSIATSIGGKKDANAVFLGCCKTAKVAKSCERICNFDILNKKVLTGMFLGTDPCPQSYGLELLQCAAQSDDHTTCCRSKGVHTTSAGDKCLGFCNMRPGVSFQADVSMLPCWGVLNDIKSCFKESILNS